MDEGHGKIPDETGSFPLFHHQSLPQTDVYRLGNRGTSCRTTKPVLCCVVCGDSSSGKHYGVLACNGCSGFFKRSVRRKLIYRCQAASGDCLVDKAHRNQCQACRLKKCLECGMNRDAVQNERQPRNSATVRPDFQLSSTSRTYIKGPSTTVLDSTVSDITVGVFSPFFTLPSKIFPTTHFGIPKFQHPHDLKDEAASTSVSLNKIVSDDSSAQFQSLSMMSRIDIKPESMFDPTEETIYETSAHILLLTIRWARNLPSYSSLCFEDQILLLEETWSELFLLSAIQWGIPLNSNPLFAAVETVLPKLTSVQRQNLCMLQRASTRFKILATDLAEFACIKAIILFKSDAGRLKDTYQVEMLQDHAQLMLAHHIKTQHIDYIFRFGRLLLILPSLRQIPPLNVEAIFFSNILRSTPMEKLLSDMFNS